MASVFTACGSSWGVFAGLKHLLPCLGHGMTVLTSGRPAHLFVTAHAVKMVGAFQSGLIYMIKHGIVQFVQVIFVETIAAVTFFAGNDIGFTAFGMTADTIRVGYLSTRGMVVTLHTGCYSRMHGVIKINTAVVLGQTVDFNGLRRISSLHGSAWFRPDQHAPNG
jgi:hypothetical protein